MRAFIVVAHKFKGDINLNDLPGSGRIDVVCRCINAAIFMSHRIRKDVEFYAYFPNLGVRIRIYSSRVKYLNPDERSTAALIRNAIKQGATEEEKSSSPGFYIKKSTFENLLKEVSSKYSLYHLHEEGDDIREIRIEPNPAFVLSDSLNLTEEEEKIVDKYSMARISVSPRSLLGSHAIVITHNELDRRGL